MADKCNHPKITRRIPVKQLTDRFCFTVVHPDGYLTHCEHCHKTWDRKDDNIHIPNYIEPPKVVHHYWITIMLMLIISGSIALIIYGN